MFIPRFLCPWKGQQVFRRILQVGIWNWSLPFWTAYSTIQVPGRKWWRYHSWLWWTMFPVEPKNQRPYRGGSNSHGIRTEALDYQSTVHVPHYYFTLVYTALCGFLNTNSLMLSHFLSFIVQQIWIHKAIGYLLPQNQQGIRYWYFTIESPTVEIKDR